MSKKTSAPTMKDVALEAGVALGTVSKVINGLPVGESYRIRVEKAIEKLNYHVNSYAQGLKSNKTYTVAFLVPNTLNPFFAGLTHYINYYLMKRNYKMLLCTTDGDIEAEQKYIELVEQNKVDGIIGLTYHPKLQINETIPFISIDRAIRPHIPCVSSDNFLGGQMAAEKLAELGCKHVAFFRIGSSLNNEPNKRKAGFENGCLAKNLSYTSKILQDNDSMVEFREFLTEHFHDGKLDFDGIFCVTDYIVSVVLKILKGLHLSVPDDVQVIGFDGVQPFPGDSYFCSSIVQPVKDIAQMSVDLLLQDNIGMKPPLVCLPVSYIAGGTTKEPVAPNYYE